VGASQKQKSSREDASTASGYKDKLVGGVKATVGNLFGLEHMEKEGQKQKQKGEAELKAAIAQQRAVGDQQRQLRAEKRKGHLGDVAIHADLLVKRQALLSQLERTGGFAGFREQLKHVEPRERNVRELFLQGGENWQQFHLKRRDDGPLLDEIRERRTRRPLLHVETEEKGLLRSIKLNDKDFKLKRRDPNRLWSDIRTNNIDRLRKVNRNDIRDRSPPRLSVLKNLKAVHQQHHILLREVAAPPRLRHAQTNDKTKPSLFFDRNVYTNIKGEEKDKLLKEVRQGLDNIHHAETNDKSRPVIEKDLRL